MKRWMRRIGRLATAAAIAFVLGGPAASWADEVRGRSLVMAKDLAEGTILVNGGRVLHVSATTAFADAAGGRMTFAELPVARQDAPQMYVVSADATIEWEGTRRGDRIVVHRVQMAGEALE